MKIEQKIVSAVDMLRDIRQGRLLPVIFQRGYAWSKKDVEGYLNSLVKGYPTGSFFLWKVDHSAYPTGLISKNHLGPIHLTEAKSALSLILDGQNRLATLAWALSDSPKEFNMDLSAIERQTWQTDDSLVLDFATRSIKFLPSDEAEIGLRVPVWTLGDNSKSRQFMRTKLALWEASTAYRSEEIDSFFDFYDSANNSIMRQASACMTVHDASLEQAKDIFLNVCRVGVPITEEEFDAALNFNLPTQTLPGP